MPKLLFITHETSRTGAPIVLLELLKWIKTNRLEWHISVLSLNKGVLAEDFSTLANEFFELSKPCNRPSRIRKLIKRSVDQEKKLIDNLSNKRFDLIYANTVVSIPIACRINNLGKAKLIVHVHEMETVIKFVLPNFGNYVEQIDGFIAASNKVRDNLTVKYDIDTFKIQVLYGFIKPGSKNKEVKEDHFIIGGAGTVHWRKGSDIFIQVANYIRYRFPDLNMKFFWAGAISRKEELIVKADIKKAGLEEMVFFDGERVDLDEFINSLDIFLLPSREDPFPLVAIEAAQKGKPIICFEKATGTAEKLNEGGGKVVPYLDIQEMAEAVLYYARNSDQVAKDSKAAKLNFGELIPEIMGERYARYIEKFLK